MSKPIIHIGCSSYYNRLWKGIFYPEDLPGSKWFEYYCTQFNTYELNSTFYKFPTAKTLQTWYKKTPEGFLFSAKAPKLITHTKRFEDCGEELENFYTACREGLADKLACILFQLPPSFGYTQERLQMLVSSLNPDFKNAIEFRNESWWVPEVFYTLEQNNISFCGVNYPNLPTGFIATNDIAYYRFHGSPRLFYSEYSTEELQETYGQLLSQAGVKEAYIYFNNTASEGAIVNALHMKSML